MSMKLDGSDRRYIARGIRNTVGFEWDHETGDLWFTDNGRDQWGDDMPPDELNHVPSNGQHFGYPYCYGNQIPDPQFNPSRDCSKYVKATYSLGPHVAALGMAFYQGKSFPSQFHNQIFIAEHGSWNRRVPIGYRVTWVNKNDPSPQSYKTFIDGWLQLPNTTAKFDSRYSWGRPVDVINYKDGILISDDKGGALYYVSKK